LKIPKEQSETVYRRRTDNTMAKRKSTKGQTTIDKTYRTYKTKDRVTRTPLKPGVNSGAPEGWAVPAPLVVSVVLI
jgi:ribosomal protein L21E